MLLLKKYSKLLRLQQLLSRKLSMSAQNSTEIQIPVPWGKIVGKWWGPTNIRPILCVHGWQDNANTFDNIIPHLPNQSYLALDYPGHGLSSHYPPGMFYYQSDFLLLLRRIHKHFGWPKISLLAHSLGGNLSFLYASLYPDEVDFLIAIDGLKPRSYGPGGIIDKMSKTIDNFIKYDEINASKNEPPSYKLEDIADKMHAATFQSIDLDKCEVLYKRNIKASERNPGEFYFTRDSRLKAGSLTCWQHEDLKEYMKRVKCPMVFIRTIKSRIAEDPVYLKDAVETLQKYNRNFEFVEFDGKHHDHLNAPEKMALVINRFLAKYDLSNRTLKENQKLVKCSL